MGIELRRLWAQERHLELFYIRLDRCLGLDAVGKGEIKDETFQV